MKSAHILLESANLVNTYRSYSTSLLLFAKFFV
jgi:hypothetical protein